VYSAKNFFAFGGIYRGTETPVSGTESARYKQILNTALSVIIFQNVLHLLKLYYQSVTFV